MVAPNIYVLGAKPELDLTFTDLDGDPFTPVQYRLSIKQPDGDIITVSGAELTQASGYLFYLYSPPEVGWYEYEGWGKDGNDREVAQTNGFEVIDHVY